MARDPIAERAVGRWQAGTVGGRGGRAAAWHADVARSLDAGHLARTPILAVDPASGRIVGASHAARMLLELDVAVAGDGDDAVGSAIRDLVERQVAVRGDVRRVADRIDAWRQAPERGGAEEAHSFADEVRIRTGRGWVPVPVTVVVHRRPQTGGEVVVVAAPDLSSAARGATDPDEARGPAVRDRASTFWSVTDGEARVVAIDPRAAALWNDPDALIGTLTAMLAHPEHVARVLPLAHELYRGIRSAVAYTVRVAASDGTWVPLHVELRRLATADGSTLILADNRVIDGTRRAILPGDLTPRETEIVDLLFDGLRVRQIAERNGVSAHTVRNQLQSAYRKLGVSGQAELVATCHRPAVALPDLDVGATAPPD